MTENPRLSQPRCRCPCRSLHARCRTATSSSLRHRIATVGGGGGCGGGPGAAAGCWGGCGVMKVSVNAAWEPWAALGVSALGRPRRLRAGMQHLGRRRRQSHSAATLYNLYRDILCIEPPVKIIYRMVLE